jgi:PAS domain S-box-containing protein
MLTPTKQENTFKDDETIVSKTDTKGNITYGNRLFIKMSGYSEEELIGAPHNIIRHPDMPAVVFKLLWDTVAQGKEIFAYVKNMAKDGSFYWVFANVTASRDMSGNIIGYHSVRRAPSKKAVQAIEGVYKLLNDAESKGGMPAAYKLLVDFLTQKGCTYEELVLSL